MSTKKAPGASWPALEDLTKQEAVDEHLFTPADEAVVFVSGMGHVLIPSDEPVRPSHAIDWPRVIGFPPTGEQIRASDHDALSGNCFKANRRLGCAAGLQEHVFPVNTAAEQDNIPRTNLARSPGDGLPGLLRGSEAIVGGPGVLLGDFKGRG